MITRAALCLALVLLPGCVLTKGVTTQVTRRYGEIPYVEVTLFKREW